MLEPTKVGPHSPVARCPSSRHLSKLTNRLESTVWLRLLLIRASLAFDLGGACNLAPPLCLRLSSPSRSPASDYVRSIRGVSAAVPGSVEPSAFNPNCMQRREKHDRRAATLLAHTSSVDIRISARQPRSGATGPFVSIFNRKTTECTLLLSSELSSSACSFAPTFRPGTRTPPHRDTSNGSVRLFLRLMLTVPETGQRLSRRLASSSLVCLSRRRLTSREFVPQVEFIPLLTVSRTGIGVSILDSLRLR